MDKKINTFLLILIIILEIFLICQNLQKREDLNNDGVVNSADLLYLRKYLIEMVKE